MPPDTRRVNRKNNRNKGSTEESRRKDSAMVSASSQYLLVDGKVADNFKDVPSQQDFLRFSLRPAVSSCLRDHEVARGESSIDLTEQKFSAFYRLEVGVN